MRFRIDDSIFDAFPELCTGVLIARDLDNSSREAEVSAKLLEISKEIQSSWSLERLSEEPKIKVWQEAYRAFKAKPKKHKCSVENLLHYILEGNTLWAINTLVDLYNYTSVKHCIPAGGDDLDKVEGDILLTYAKGGELFIPLNSVEPVPPKEGEVVYRDSRDILCRRWNWRECDRSKLTEESKNVCLVLEGIAPTTAAEVQSAAEELTELILHYCGGKVETFLLDRNCREIEF